MIFYLILCNILFIPLIFCSNITVSKQEIENKTTNKVSESHRKTLTNESKVALLSEGGSIMPDTLGIALPKGNDSATGLGNEVSKNKVVPRKGVVYSENVTQPQELVKSSELSTSQSVTPGHKSSSVHEPLKITPSVLNGKSTLLDSNSNITKKLNETKTPKKPLILHSDVLENMTVKSSSGTIIKDQIQSPNQDVQSYLANANSHPGIVMPIVITILLVPMFAVLGYMALRRGKEAWKNRHYKRMDFLLDGMYND